MRAAVIFPDVELAVTGYLRSRLINWPSPVRVSTSYQGKALEVVVRRDGGPNLDQLREAARVGINVYATSPTDQAVSDLARQVSALMRAMPDGTPVLRVTQSSGPSPIPESSGVTRRYLTFEVYVRGTQL